MCPIHNRKNAGADTRNAPLPFILLAGAFGGAAEIIWVCLLSISSPASGVEIARGITAALWPAMAAIPAAPAIGILIHMGLSFAITFVFAATVWKPALRLTGRGGLIIISLLSLGLIWVFNFFFLLPIIAPAFVHLLPLPATLFSKLLFGLAMGAVLADSTATSGMGLHDTAAGETASPDGISTRERVVR